MSMVRTFVAIELTPQVVDALQKVQIRLRQAGWGQAGRWVRSEGIHLTLKFLGDVPAEELEAVYQAVRRSCEGRVPFVLALAGLGCFPNPRRPRVVWVGVREETGQLMALQQAVEQELGCLGFEREKRAFRPHLTLARIKKQARRQEIDALGKAVAQHEAGEVAQMKVDSVSVIKSDLRREGAIYTELYRMVLAHEE